MEECNICLTKIKNQNKSRHEQSNKHKYFPNLIINKYIVRKLEIDKFRDIIQSYYDKHKKKFDNFFVCVMWKKNDVLIKKISVSSTTTPEKPHLFKPSMIELPIVKKVSPIDFLDTVDESITEGVDEIDIKFTSDLHDITFSHYMDQPKSMIQRKLIKKFFEEDYGKFDCNWLPKCFGNF